MKGIIKGIIVALAISLAGAGFAQERERGAQNRLGLDVQESVSLADQGLSVVVDSVEGDRVATMFYEPAEQSAGALSFILNYPKGFSADTTDCLTDLPQGFQGGCKAVGNQVRVILYSPELAALPATLLGSVIFTPARSAESRTATLAAGNTGEAFSLEQVDLGRSR